MLLSVIVPMYDEAATAERALRDLLAVALPCELEVLVVDDGSRDRTAAEVRAVDDSRVRLLSHRRNRGKGAAVRTAAAAARGDWLLVYDADLEYDPADIPALVAPVLSGRAEVVYGHRGLGPHSSHSLWYVLGNRAVTMTANVLYNCYLGDLETGFKLLPAELFRSLRLRSEGFGLEAELTAKLLARGIRPYEVPISYRARSRAAGKKITWRDGLQAVRILGRERLRGASKFR